MKKIKSKFYEMALARATESDKDKAGRSVASKLRTNTTKAETFVKEKSDKIDDLEEELENIRFDPNISFEEFFEKEKEILARKKELELVKKSFEERYA